MNRYLNAYLNWYWTLRWNSNQYILPKIPNRILKIIRVCPHCGGFGAKTRRLNTAYVHEPSNWLYSCEEVYLDAVEYYQERWDDIIGKEQDRVDRCTEMQGVMIKGICIDRKAILEIK